MIFTQELTDADDGDENVMEALRTWVRLVQARTGYERATMRSSLRMTGDGSHVFSWRIETTP